MGGGGRRINYLPLTLAEPMKIYDDSSRGHGRDRNSNRDGGRGRIYGKKRKPPQERHVDLVDLFLSLSFVRERRDSFDSFFLFELIGGERLIVIVKRKRTSKEKIISKIGKYCIEELGMVGKRRLRAKFRRLYYINKKEFTKLVSNRYIKEK